MSRKGRAALGQTHRDAVLMFKMLILQHLCNLAYEGLNTSSATGSPLCVFLAATARPGVWRQETAWLSGNTQRLEADCSVV